MGNISDKITDAIEDDLEQLEEDVENIISQRYSKTPSKKKSFIKNYFDHLEATDIELGRIWNLAKELITQNKLQDAFFLLASEAINRIKIVKALHDRYDYFDEVMGATAIPGYLLIVAGLSTLIAGYESLMALAIRTGLAKNDEKNHGTKALLALGVSFFSLLSSLVVCLKSIISLATRPIVTAFTGYEKSDKNRFYKRPEKGITDSQKEALTNQLFDKLIAQFK